MHQNLASHLHSDECNILIDEYKKCMEENKYGRFIGTCSSFQRKVEKCLLDELKQKRAEGEKKRKEADLEYFSKKNPNLAEKIKQYEKFKSEQQQSQK